MIAVLPGGHGGHGGWTSWEFDAALCDLCRYAPRGLRVDGVQFVSSHSHSVSEGKWVVRLRAPGHPLHPSLVVSFEADAKATHDELAMQFHLACQRWLESVA